VTPFLTQDGLARTRRLIDALLAHWSEMEIVCNDWGLLWDLATGHAGRLALGRLLVGQSLDPRIVGMLAELGQAPAARVIHHVDGTACLLRYRAASTEAAAHFRAVSADQAEMIDFFAGFGVERCEISHLRHGLLTSGRGWRYSLHRPWIPLSVQRCHGSARGRCPCRGEEQVWSARGFPVPLIHRDNVVGYRGHFDPADDSALIGLGIDRIVEGPDS